MKGRLEAVLCGFLVFGVTTLLLKARIINETHVSKIHTKNCGLQLTTRKNHQCSLRGIDVSTK